MKIMIKCALVLSACIYIMAAFAGCAASNMGLGPVNPPEGVNHPKLPAGIKTFEDARMDLAGLLENRQSPLDLYFGENYFAQHNVRDLVADIAAIEEGTIAGVKEYNVDTSSQYPLNVETKTIYVRDDMLKVSARLFVLYAGLPDLPITYNSETVFLGNRQVAIGRLNEEEAQRIADDLFFIQQDFKNSERARNNRHSSHRVSRNIGPLQSSLPCWRNRENMSFRPMP